MAAAYDFFAGWEYENEDVLPERPDHLTSFCAWVEQRAVATRDGSSTSAEVDDIARKLHQAFTTNEAPIIPIVEEYQTHFQLVRYMRQAYNDALGAPPEGSICLCWDFQDELSVSLLVVVCLGKTAFLPFLPSTRPPRTKKNHGW